MRGEDSYRYALSTGRHACLAHAATHCILTSHKRRSTAMILFVAASCWATLAWLPLLCSTFSFKLRILVPMSWSLYCTRGGDVHEFSWRVQRYVGVPPSDIVPAVQTLELISKPHIKSGEMNLFGGHSMGKCQTQHAWKIQTNHAIKVEPRYAHTLSRGLPPAT